MLRADMNVSRVDRVLEQLPERLDAVGREFRSGPVIGPSPFLAAVIDGAVHVPVAGE